MPWYYWALIPPAYLALMIGVGKFIRGPKD